MKKALIRVVLAGLLLLGCGDRDDRFETWKGADGPLPVGKHVVYVDHNFDQVLVLEPHAGDTTPDWDRLPIAQGGKLVGVVKSLGVVLVQSAEEGLLQAVNPETGAVTDHDTGGSYDRFVVLEDPPLVAAFYSENAQGEGDTLLVNKGEVAFVDLKKSEGSVRKVTIPTYGGAPLGVDIAPRVPAKGGRLLAFIRWNSVVTIVDVERDAQPVSIPLKAPDSTAFVSPLAMSFHVLGNRLLAFFLAKGSKDLYLLDIDPNTLAPDGTGVSLNLFPTAAGASRLALFRLAGNAPGVIVLSRSSRMAAVVNPESSEVSLYPLKISASNLEIFEMPSPESGKSEQYAFLYDDSGNSFGYYFVELERLKEKKSQAFHYYALSSRVRKVYPLGVDRFLVMHDSGPSPMSLVNAADSSVISIGGGLTMSAEVLPLGGTTMYAIGTKQAKSYLLAFDVTTFATRSIEVGHGLSPNKVQLMEDSGLLLVSEGAYGLVVVPEAFTNEEDAVEILVPLLLGLASEEVVP